MESQTARVFRARGKQNLRERERKETHTARFAKAKSEREENL